MSGQSFDAVVIGSGLGGMSAGAYLAAAGKRVAILERHSVIGGSSLVFRRRGRWEFDAGVHYIGDCGPTGQVPTLMRGLGLDEHIEFLPLDRNGFDTIIGPDLRLRVPFGWDAYLENLLEAFPREEKALRRYVSVMRSLGAALDDRARGIATPAKFGTAIRKAGMSAPWMMAPLAPFLAACGLRPPTILALSVQCGVVASTPMSATVGTMAGFLQNYVAKGAYYPRGGGQMLSAAFGEVIRGHGGVVRVNAQVERIMIEGERATGVDLTTGETIRADTVVSNADVIRTYRDLVGTEYLPAATRARMRSWRMSLPLINGCFGVELDVDTMPNTNYFAIPSWDDAGSLPALLRMNHTLFRRNRAAADRDEWARNFAIRQPMFVQCSTRRDPANRFSAPAGHASIEVQTIVPPSPALWGVGDYTTSEIESGEYRGSQPYREMKDAVMAGMRARLEQAYPGAGSRIRFSELGTPATQTRYTAASGGNAFGLEPNAVQTGPLRPGVGTPIAGLFIVGTSTTYGPATEGSMISGLQAAAAVTGRDLLAEIRAGGVIADRARIRDWDGDVDPLAVQRDLTHTQATTRVY